LDEAATCAAITAGLEWLAQDGVESDAVRVFHYSGHGSYLADRNGDEPDGRDECLVPYDYRIVGLLTDDTLKSYYDRFPRKGNLTLVMDSCHSGSVQRDLQQDFIYRFLPVSSKEQEKIDAAAAQFAEDQKEFVIKELLTLRGREMSEEELRRKVGSLMSVFEKKRFGDVRLREANVLLAGCRADQQSADAHIAGDYHGAFTYYLAEAIVQSNGQIAYRQLAEQTGNKLGAAHFAQIPQLEYRASRDQQMAFRPFP
jgi:metacaspase-1